jgi:hypothetical protein
MLIPSEIAASVILTFTKKTGAACGGVPLPSPSSPLAGKLAVNFFIVRPFKKKSRKKARHEHGIVNCVPMFRDGGFVSGQEIVSFPFWCHVKGDKIERFLIH